VLATRISGGGGLFDDDQFDRTALLVEAVEFGGERLGLGRVSGGEQAHAQVGLADAAAGVDPRTEREA